MASQKLNRFKPRNMGVKLKCFQKHVQKHQGGVIYSQIGHFSAGLGYLRETRTMAKYGTNLT